MKKKKNHTKG